MSETPNEENPQHSQPSTVAFEEDAVQRSEEERQRKFEEDKARKEKYKDAHPTWSAEAWNAARAARAAGVVEPVQMIPIIINEFLTPQMVQEVCRLPEVPTVELITTAPENNDDTHQPEELPYCVVPGRRSRGVIRKAFPGDSVLVWFEGEKRFAWAVTGEKKPSKSEEEQVVEQSEDARLRMFEEDKARKEEYKNAHPPWSAEDWNAARAARAAARAGKGPPEPWFPIVVNNLMTSEKVQEICGLESPPKVEWITTAPFENEHIVKPERLQYCAVQGREACCLVREASHGYTVLVWFGGKRRAAWIATEKDPDDEAESDSAGGNEC